MVSPLSDITNSTNNCPCVYICDHFNTTNKSKHLSFSFCAPKLVTVNWRLKYYFLFLREYNSVYSILRVRRVSFPLHCPVILHYLTPHYLLNTIAHQVICTIPWILPKRNICTKLGGEKGKYGMRLHRGRWLFLMRRNKEGRIELGYYWDDWINKQVLGRIKLWRKKVILWTFRLLTHFRL